MSGNSENRSSRLRSPTIGSGGSSSAAGAARHLAVSLLVTKLPGVTVAQAVTRMRCRVWGDRCGAPRSYVRIEEYGSPEHRDDRLQVVLIGVGVAD